MAFEFDTGQTTRPNPASAGLNDAWEDGVRDQLPANHTEAQFLRAAGDQIINDIWAHRSREGVRWAMWKRVTLMQRLLSLEPTTFDRVVTELAERLMLLADDLPAAAGSRNPGGNGANPPKTTGENFDGF